MSIIEYRYGDVEFDIVATLLMVKKKILLTHKVIDLIALNV